MNKIGVHFGYFNRDWNTDFIKRIEQVKKIGLDILEVAPAPLLALTKFQRDEIAGAIKLVGNRLGHFHVGESNRRPPCENGKMPWNEITNALKEIDYQGAIVMEPFIKMGGEVGRDIKVWRDISEGASESEMEQLLADAAMMLRKKMQR